MPGPYSSYITAVQGIYAGLTAASFPGSTPPPGPFVDEAPLVTSTGAQLTPPYVILRDLGSDPKWTFTTDVLNAPGQNALVVGEFVLEAYAPELGTTDAIIAAILWNGQTPNTHAGLAFAALSLISPQGGITGAVVPGKTQRNNAGFQYNNAYVHVTKQWFRVQTKISGNGL